MRHLERLVTPLLGGGAVQQGGTGGSGAGGGGLSSFKLPPDCLLSIPKWGKAMGWSARDDAMLLVGEAPSHHRMIMIPYEVPLL